MLQVLSVDFEQAFIRAKDKVQGSQAFAMTFENPFYFLFQLRAVAKGDWRFKKETNI